MMSKHSLTDSSTSTSDGITDRRGSSHSLCSLPADCVRPHPSNHAIKQAFFLRPVCDVTQATQFSGSWMGTKLSK